MTALHWILLLAATQRVAELALAARNTGRLMAQGATEYGAAHYPLFVVLHGAWLASLLVFVPAGTPPNPWLVGLLAILLLGRIWVMMSLGPYWTTRIIRLPRAPIIRTGPYRWIRHPNYVIVVGEIAVLPLIFGAWEIALLFSLLNALLLRHRIRIENAALEETA